MRAARREDITVPNFLTILRIAAALVAAVMFMSDYREGWAAFLCIGASILDYFDGWYARKFHQKSRLGAHLDPFADKVLIGTIFIILAGELDWQWFNVFVAIILLREFLITIYRMMVRRRFGSFIPASILGKVKTTAQCLVGDLLLFYIYIQGGEPSRHITLIFVTMTLILFITIDSGLRYLLPSCSDGKKRSVLERVYHWILGLCTSRV